MLRASLQGQLKQTHLPRWRPLQPLFEAIMNAYQAAQDIGERGEILVRIEREQSLPLGGTPPISGFIVSDNGSGFTDENMDSFNTTFSQYKEQRGGKGLGRFLYLKAFEEVSIDSVFHDAEKGSNLSRTFNFDPVYDPARVSLPAPTSERVGTTVVLKGFLEPYRSEIPTEADKLARQICEHFILILMGANSPSVRLIDGTSNIDVNQVFETEFRGAAVHGAFTLHGRHFSVLGFKIREAHSARHRIIYCAHDRAVVSEALAKWLPNLSTRLVDDRTELCVSRGRNWLPAR